MKRLLLVILLLGCERQVPKHGREFVDSRGKTVVIANPLRVVSIIPSITEMVYAAGAGHRLVGVSDYCDYPEDARALPRLGGTTLDYERLLSLKPDLVLSSQSLHRERNERLEQLGCTVFTLDPATLEEVIQAVALLEKIFDTRGRSEELRRRLASVRPATGEPRVFFEYGAGPIYAAGRKSHIGDIIARAGGRNVLEDAWPVVEWEKVLTLRPQIVLVAHHEPDKVRGRPGWAELGAKLCVVDPDLFLRAGPRLMDALELTVRLLQ